MEKQTTNAPKAPRNPRAKKHVAEATTVEAADAQEKRSIFKIRQQDAAGNDTTFDKTSPLFSEVALELDSGEALLISVESSKLKIRSTSDPSEDVTSEVKKALNEDFVLAPFNKTVAHTCAQLAASMRFIASNFVSPRVVVADFVLQQRTLRVIIPGDSLTKTDSYITLVSSNK